ncbi:hypothetical protein DRW03_25775 [Corallococcus sp. H22C18031201]|uniref:hypothetical protein n=1 Tax=Citreicoccus inhibens TaxID=2849499 RepID=UPI000E725412|nr:hypothetical protein [Citreicoccus inhibens]MBU8898084.1 hypothetical protein [Citreicoccus inhibens]RJS17974.1 hypothetical protein DRW03_25775 [Corallococcus sp. H22C18031201]
MNAMKTFLSTCVSLVMLASVPGLAAEAEQSRIDEQVGYGLKEMQRILSRDAAGLAEFGLKDARELEQLRVGAPVEAFRLDPAGLNAYAPGAAIAPLLTPMDELFFPVKVNGKTRLVMWLAKLDGVWQFAGFGQSDLATAWDGLSAKYAQPGARLRFVLQAQTQAKLLLVVSGGQERIFYLSNQPWSFNAAIRADQTALRQPELMQQLKESANQMLRN